MKKELHGMLMGIYTEEPHDDKALIARSLSALHAAGLRANEKDVKGALNTCHDPESFAWDLVRFARGEEDKPT